MVFAAEIGQIHAYGAIIVFTFSLFIEALSAEFGWSRAQISLAFTLPSYTIIAVAPIVGRLIDHFGVRVVLLRSSIFLGILTASLYLLDGSLWHFYAVFFLLPILGAGTFPTSYSRAIINWFDRRRGIALGIGLVGTGVGAAILPPTTSNVIALYGWRVRWSWFVGQFEGGGARTCSDQCWSLCQIINEGCPRHRARK